MPAEHDAKEMGMPNADLLSRLREPLALRDAHLVIRRLLAERAEAADALAALEWRPIASAPRDGTNILALYPIFKPENSTNIPDEYRHLIIHWKGLFWDTGFWMLHADPAGWLPLPPPPAEGVAA